MRILGIHDGHNAAACMLEDGEIVAAAQEERFSRIKNQSGFPVLAVNWLLSERGLSEADVDFVAMNGEHCPYPTTREELMREYASTNLPETRLKNMLKMTPFYSLFRGRRKRERLGDVSRIGFTPEKVVFVDHHMAHASAAYYGSPWRNERVLVLSNDGAGDGLCATVNIGEKGRLRRIAEIAQEHSLGNLYAMITFIMGMVPLEHEYKLMGMAPYAPKSGAQQVYARLMPLLQFDKVGLTWHRAGNCPNTYYSYEYFTKLLRLCRFDWVCAGLQTFTEIMLTEWVSRCVRETGISKVALAGGVFMNVKANKLISELPEVESIFVYPSCGDETNAMGAAYWLYANKKTDDKERDMAIPPLRDIYFGPEYLDEDIEEALSAVRGTSFEVSHLNDIEARVAELLSQGNVVARLKGKMEFGARSLGNRSILADPADVGAIKVINDMIKSRDFWMPFAPSVLREHSEDYLRNPKGINAPYMIMAFDTTSKVNEIAAAVHPYDLSVRPQVVDHDWNPDYHNLIRHFQQITGRGAIMNTSFNLHGDPIVCSPQDAISVLKKSGLRFLAAGNFLIEKVS